MGEGLSADEGEKRRRAAAAAVARVIQKGSSPREARKGGGTAGRAPRPAWGSFVSRARQAFREFFFGADPDFATAIVPFCFLSMLLYTRHPTKTNFIFDEQEALLANPYVRSVSDPASKLRWIDAFYRDFWGLPPDRTIGSYRPIPDLVWRLLWKCGVRENPFLDHWINVLVHGVNGALVTLFVVRITKDRFAAWLAGALFVAAAIVTEAVSGVVGIADVFGGTGALLALLALTLPIPAMLPAVFGATLFGLYSKESALACVPLVPLAALYLAPATHPLRPQRALRTLAAATATATAFVLYVEARRRMFPARLSPDLSAAANAGKGVFTRAFAAMLRWYAQPMLPHDPLNNPLVLASRPYRIAGALRVYFRGLVQIVYPTHLSGDYSAPQEPIPEKLIFPESVLGAILMIGPLVASAALFGLSLIPRQRRAAVKRASPINIADSGQDFDAVTMPASTGFRLDLRPLVGFCLAWIVVSYIPVSNIPISLPTVRAERFWYFPAIGTSILLGFAFAGIFRWLRLRSLSLVGVSLILGYFVIQGYFARLHANDYTNDLVFWDSTRRAVPRSAKAHLNYSVMLGARGDLEGRLKANAVAIELAPNWAMANVYYGDTLCRLHRTQEAFTYYRNGFEQGPNESNLVALGLQCLWDEKALQDPSPFRDPLDEMGRAHPGSWLEYLARDILERGEEHGGVDPKYRPRAYNEGPKGE